MTREEIYVEMQQALMDVLGLDADEVEPSSRFFHDLQGESIDLLDLSFQCQKKFGIDLKFQNLTTTGFLDTDDAGNLTAASAQRFQTAYPFLDIEQLRSDPSAEGIKNMLTVDALISMVEHALTAVSAK
ncbi:acyl carrier protein [Symmachiella dynata]|uniref:acyl carrier protein n=1 Tax=Symmachiella dynata TaxID=2527995 RepID=UPI00118A5B7F|nr:phosphopantetheine-binding protein [Symmachiella dynata]QDT49431.1 acyl carrier protein [Symmachiella dynata]